MKIVAKNFTTVQKNCKMPFFMLHIFYTLGSYNWTLNLTKGYNMFYKITRVVFALISTVVMFKFAFPKLQAMPKSANSFEMFGDVLHINGSFFMYFTGVVELVIAVLLLSSLFIKKELIQNRLQIIGYLLLLGTMIGAILVEQFVRTEPKAFLMTLALVLSTISISELSILSKYKKV